MQKRLLFFCSGVILLLLACSRKQIAAADETSAARLTGTWELREAQSGMTPATQHQPGNGNRFSFTGSTYEQFKNGSLLSSGSYTIVPDTTVTQEVGLVLPEGEFRQRLVLSNSAVSSKTFIQRTGTQLVFLSGFFPTDGGSRYTYEKIADGR